MEEITQDIWQFGTDLFSNGLLMFIINAVIALLIAKVLVHCIHKGFKKAKDQYSEKRTMLGFTEKIIKVVIYCLAVFSFIDEFKPLAGIGTAALGATSVVTVIIGLAAQETFGNFIAGFILAMYQPFHVGDVVTLPEKGISGTVKTITFRQTELNTVENAKLIIPNSVMGSAIIEDKAFGQSGYTKYLSFDIGYDSNVNKAEECIYDAVLSTPHILDNRTEEQKKNNVKPFVIRVEDFEANGIKIVFPMTADSFGTSFEAASEIRKKLLISFQKNGIEIPYQKVQILEDHHH